MVSLKLQKRLAASVLKCGERKIWLDPNEVNEISLANSRRNIARLHRDGLIIKKPTIVHSRARANAWLEAKRKGRHTGHGKRRGTANARLPFKVIWMDAQNAAHNAARRYIVSPVAAARFMLAKMRGAEDPKPRLGGVYMLGSCARTFAGEAFVRKNFILGDFFVADKSPVRFDQEMTLKEDYDFTCAHINAHGSVMRCNRMTLNVKHYSNAGGACTNRDKKGLEERRNIDILHRKWPGAFRRHPRRHNEVILQLSRGRLSGGCGGDGDDEEDADGGEEKKTASPSKGGRAERAKKQQLGRVRRTIAKRRGGLQRSVPRSPASSR